MLSEKVLKLFFCAYTGGLKMEPVRFEDLGVDERILRAVTEMGFEEATPIQNFD